MKSLPKIDPGSPTLTKVILEVFLTSKKQALLFVVSTRQTTPLEQVRSGRGERREQAEAAAGPAGGGSEGDLLHQARAQHEARHLKIQANTGMCIAARRWKFKLGQQGTHTNVNEGSRRFLGG